MVLPLVPALLLLYHFGSEVLGCQTSSSRITCSRCLWDVLRIARVQFLDGVIGGRPEARPARAAELKDRMCTERAGLSCHVPVARVLVGAEL